MVSCWLIVFSHKYVNHLLLKASSSARRTASLIWERVEDRRYSLYFKGFMFVPTGGSTSPNIPSVMDEIVFNSSSSRLSIPPLFLRWTSSSPRRWTPTSRPVEYISTGVYAASSFSSSISLHPETWETYSQRKAEGSDEDCTYTYQLQNNSILRSARLVWTYPVEIQLRGCWIRSRSKSSSFLQSVCHGRGQMSHESSSSRRAWKLMTILMGIRSQH